MIKNIQEVFDTDNVASLLSDEKLQSISQDVFLGYEIDKKSRENWEKRHKEAMALAMQIYEKKDTPIENAANVKYPLLSTAAIQFAARAYPNFISGPNTVKGIVVGDDENPPGAKAEKAERVGTYMSYQLNKEMKEWEEETDKLLTILPVLGCVFKKTWFSSSLGRNISEYRSPEVIVINYFARNLESVPRLTELYNLYPNDIEERKNKKLFLDEDYGEAYASLHEETSFNQKQDQDDNKTNDPYSAKLFIEQHAYLDLDGDGYAEPYIINACYDSKKIARIMPRFDKNGVEYGENNKIIKITPEKYYTKFTFMPSPDGSIYDWGFGSLLTPINSVVNTNLNQLLDSGTLHNSQSGFIGNGIQLGRGRGGGNLTFKLGEWKRVNFSGDDIGKNILPLPTKEPSVVLMSLLSFMVTAGEKLSTVTEIFTGGQGMHNEKATTTLARIEQGLKVFSAIHKRLYRSFAEEYSRLFDLNYKYLNPQTYFRVLDKRYQVNREDFDRRTCDVVPSADPNDLSNTEKVVKAQALLELRGQGLNDAEITKRYLEALNIPETEKLLNVPEQPPNPEMLLKIDENKLKWSQHLLEVAKFEMTGEVEAVNKYAQAMEHMAKAEAAQEGPQMELYKTNVDSIMKMLQIKGKEQSSGNNQEGVRTVEGGAGNAGSV